MSLTTTIRLDSMAFGGAAVGRLPSGKVALVHGGAPEETVRISTLQEKRSYVIASVDEVVEPSPHRREPPCRSADRCGGCGWIHLDDQAQRAWKSRLLRHELRRSGTFDDQDRIVAPMISGEPLGHRIRTRMHLVGGRFGTLGQRSHLVVPLVECPILEPHLETFALEAARALENTSLGDAEVELIIDARGQRGMSIELRDRGDASTWREIAVALQAASLRVASVKGRTLAQEGGRLLEDSAGAPLEFTPGLFVQANREMNARLIETALESAGEGRRFAEVYAGVGNFTVHLAPRFRRGLASEGSRPAAQQLRRNLGASRRHVEVRAERDHGTARRLASGPPLDLLLADPPRAGMRPLRPLFASAEPPSRVVLVSCHPMAAVRDLTHLCGAANYRLRRVVPVDMFPQTPHLELVAELER